MGHSELFILILVILVFLLLVVTFTFFAPRPAAACPPCPKSTPAAPQARNQSSPTKVIDRDINVLTNPLYPPVNRPSVESTTRLMSEPRLQPLSQDSDRYRLVGYLVNREDNRDVWKLFAREKHRGSLADFYAEAANRNYDIKVELADDIVTSLDGGVKFRDLYNLPSSVVIKHPLFGNTAYDVVEYKQATLGSGYF